MDNMDVEPAAPLDGPVTLAAIAALFDHKFDQKCGARLLEVEQAAAANKAAIQDTTKSLNAFDRRLEMIDRNIRSTRAIIFNYPAADFGLEKTNDVPRRITSIRIFLKRVLGLAAATVDAMVFRGVDTFDWQGVETATVKLDFGNIEDKARCWAVANKAIREYNDSPGRATKPRVGWSDDRTPTQQQQRKERRAKDQQQPYAGRRQYDGQPPSSGGRRTNGANWNR